MRFGKEMQRGILGVSLLILSGCATISAPVTQNETPMTQKSVANHPAGSPLEQAILSEISSMNPGERGVANAVTYVVVNAYTAASGAQCKSVRISQGASQRVRVACTSGQRWVFSNNVFLTGAGRD